MIREWVRRVCLVLVVIAGVALPATASVAGAQTPAAQTVPEGFEPVTDIPPEEQLPAAPLVAGAYAFIWLAMLVYVGLLWRRLGAVQKDLDALKRTHQR